MFDKGTVVGWDILMLFFHLAVDKSLSSALPLKRNKVLDWRVGHVLKRQLVGRDEKESSIRICEAKLDEKDRISLMVNRK